MFYVWWMWWCGNNSKRILINKFYGRHTLILLLLVMLHCLAASQPAIDVSLAMDVNANGTEQPGEFYDYYDKLHVRQHRSVTEKCIASTWFIKVGQVVVKGSDWRCLWERLAHGCINNGFRCRPTLALSSMVRNCSAASPLKTTWMSHLITLVH